MEEDEPFDAMGGNEPVPHPVSTEMRRSSQSAPPSSAFNHGKTSPPGPPPPSAFSHVTLNAVPVTPDGEPKSIRSVSQVPEASAMSTELPERWKQYEEKMETPRGESSASVARSINSAAERETAPRYLQDEHNRDSDLAGSNGVGSPEFASFASKKLNPSGLGPRQPYSFKKSSSYDTDELIRKYGGMTGISPAMSTTRSFANRGTTPPPEQVRHQALKVLDLVDDHLKTPLDIRRTQSGGFRAAPPIFEESTPYEIRRTESGAVVVEDETGGSYSFRRSASGSLTSGPAGSDGGRRVPAALSGLTFGSKERTNWNGERYSFTDPSFRDDDHFSDEDEIEQQDEPVVDIVNLESRAAASRSVHDEKKFEGDFDQPTTSWSARYKDNINSQKRILDQWDREFDSERKSARNMFMSTASNVKSAASNVWSKSEIKRDKIFGSGFSFRTAHVFGHHKNAESKPEVNLRTVWKEVEYEADPNLMSNRVHMTWQEAVLSKKKRRRLMVLLGLLLLAIIVVVATTTTQRRNYAMKASGSGVGSPISFYVTADTPYDKEAEDKLKKEITNIPGDAEFILHLGNIQNAAVSLCPETRYSDVASILKKSPVPVFMTPGADDWIKCPKPNVALNLWSNSFIDFDLNFNHALDVFRDSDHPEIFTVLTNGVLFMGLHIVSGPVFDAALLDAQEDAMLKFYYGMIKKNKGLFRAVVLFGNARPSPQHDKLFDFILGSLKTMKKPIAYIHANTNGDSVMQYSPFIDHPSVFGVGVQNGGDHPPLKITVGYGERPFIIG